MQKRSTLVLLVVGVWFVLGTVLAGVHTLELSTATNTPVTDWLREFAASIRGSRAESPIFVYVLSLIHI